MKYTGSRNILIAADGSVISANDKSEALADKRGVDENIQGK